MAMIVWLILAFAVTFYAATLYESKKALIPHGKEPRGLRKEALSWHTLQSQARLMGLSLVWEERAGAVCASGKLNGLQVLMLLQQSKSTQVLSHVAHHQMEPFVWKTDSTTTIHIDSNGLIPTQIQRVASSAEILAKWDDLFVLSVQDQLRLFFDDEVYSLRIKGGRFSIDFPFHPNNVGKNLALLIKAAETTRLLCSALEEKRLCRRLLRKVQEVPIASLMKNRETRESFFLCLSLFPDNETVGELSRTLLTSYLEPHLGRRKKLMEVFLKHLGGDLHSLAVKKALSDPVSDIRFMGLQLSGEGVFDEICEMVTKETISDALGSEVLTHLAKTFPPALVLPFFDEISTTSSSLWLKVLLVEKMRMARNHLHSHRHFPIYKFLCQKMEESFSVLTSSELKSLGSSWTWLQANMESASKVEMPFLDEVLQTFLSHKFPASNLSEMLRPLAQLREPQTLAFLLKQLNADKKGGPSDVQIAAARALGLCGLVSEVDVLRKLHKKASWSGAKQILEGSISRIQSRIKNAEKGGLSVVLLESEEGSLSIPKQEDGGLALVEEFVLEDFEVPKKEDDV